MTPLNILIVEDNFSFGLELEILVKRLNHTVINIADNSGDALVEILDKKPDVILMDIDINGKLSGIQIAEKISHLKIPVIFITSFADNEHSEKATIIENTTYLTKPVDQFTLKGALDLLLKYSLGVRKPRHYEDLRFEDGCLYLKKKQEKGGRVSFAIESAHEALSRAEQYAPIRRFSYPGEDVIYLDEQEGLFLSYVRNNIVHLFSTLSLVCLHFHERDEVEKEPIKNAARSLSGLIKSESFIDLKGSVDDEVEEVFQFYQTEKNTIHPIILAADMHEKVVTVHPYIDGNGRTSRLIMNLILLQNGFPIANIKGDNASRLSYYNALETVRTENNREHFYKLILDAAIFSLKEHIKLSGG